MQDQYILITGGNDGIGRAMAVRMAKRGAHVILASRDAERGDAAAQGIRRLIGNTKVSSLHCDLSDLQQTASAAESLLMHVPRIDVLVNNAGVFSNRRQLTADGYEWHFGINHLGHFLLTMQLLPALQSAPAPRLINTTSVAHYKGQLDLTSLRGDKAGPTSQGLAAYAQSKLANVLFTVEFARRYPSITANCAHPGLVRTRLGNKHTNWWMSMLWSLHKPLMCSPYCGTCTLAYLASSPEVANVTGRYFDDRQCLRKPSLQARNPELALQLWEYSLEAVAPFLSDQPDEDSNHRCRVRSLQSARTGPF